MKEVKLTRLERDYLKQIVTECLVQRFNRQESLAYIHAKMPQDKQIGIDYMDKVVGYIRKNAQSRLQHLQKSKDAFLSEHFRRIDELEKYQRELWVIAHTNTGDGYLRKACISELHSLTITLHNLYQMLTVYTPVSFNNNESNTRIKEEEFLPVTINNNNNNIDNDPERQF